MNHTRKGNKNTIKYECNCKACGGTGVYIGFAERHGAAVVCKGCNGTGKQSETIEYEDFKGRKTRKGIKRVYLCNPGIGVGEKEGVCKLEDFGGMPYEEWVKGKKFPKGHEMRKHSCPAWYYQTADYKKKPEWKECILCGCFSDCKNYSNKQACWERWDKELGRK